MADNQLTIAQRLKLGIAHYTHLVEQSDERHDSAKFQLKILNLIIEFLLLKSIVENLTLFSDNEHIDEVNPSYIPFLNIDYYLSKLYSASLFDKGKKEILISNKRPNLVLAKLSLVDYLKTLQNYALLPATYPKNFDFAQDSLQQDPATRRKEKIENFKKAKELRIKLEILDSDDFKSFDESLIKEIYLDQIKYLSLDAISSLESLNMEIELLSSVPENFTRLTEISDSRSNLDSKKSISDYGYTTKLEKNPQSKSKVSDLLSKQGKILQPFTITSKSQLKSKVFGTGQVLPSMSVEEYLDYELANGKMASADNSKKIESDDEEYNSDDELEKRLWDDWKDDNPKGSGNMGANIG